MFSLYVVKLISGNVIDYRPVECECLNQSKEDDCINNIAKCKSDTDKPSSCFVLWETDNVTGKNIKIYVYKNMKL